MSTFKQQEISRRKIMESVNNNENVKKEKMKENAIYQVNKYFDKLKKKSENLSTVSSELKAKYNQIQINMNTYKHYKQAGVFINNLDHYMINNYDLQYFDNLKNDPDYKEKTFNKLESMKTKLTNDLNDGIMNMDELYILKNCFH